MFVDAPRYAYSAVFMAVYDAFRNRVHRKNTGVNHSDYSILSSVSVIIAGIMKPTRLQGPWNLSASVIRMCN